ncbi:MAG: hypothetical protein ACK53T_00230 [Planctomycetota bacterium]|jgi:hypothetical protein
MTFKDETWEERVEVLGDPGEQAFQEYAARRVLACVKYGLDRPPVDLRRVPAFVRYTPDFLTDEGLIEVQGCGKDQLFKFKHEKLRALMQWNRQTTIRLWLWNQPLNDWRMLPLGRIYAMCRLGGGRTAALRTDGIFDGNKPYASVPWVDVI